MRKQKIIPPIFIFESEEERRYAVEEVFIDFEYCNIPYIAGLLVDTERGVKIDYELINLDKSNTETRKYLQTFTNSLKIADSIRITSFGTYDCVDDE